MPRVPIPPAVLLVATACLLVLYAELGSFAWSGWACRASSGSGTITTTIAALADLHVAADAPLATWQLRRTAWAVRHFLRPDTVVLLGDQLDRTARLSPTEWRHRVRTYRDAMRNALGPPIRLVVDSVIGNHEFADYAFDPLSHDLTSRFELDFGKTNGKTEADGVEFYWIHAMGLSRLATGAGGSDNNNISNPDDGEVNARRAPRPETLRETNAFIEHETAKRKPSASSAPGPAPLRVLLSHLPLYRENDLGCGPERVRESGGHARYQGPGDALVPGKDVLSASDTARVVRAILPAVVLSGHTHARCTLERWYDVSEDRVGVKIKVKEITVPSSSWINRVDPGFVVLELRALDSEPSPAWEVRNCALPNQVVVVFLEMLAAGCVLACVWIWVRRRGTARSLCWSNNSYARLR